MTRNIQELPYYTAQIDIGAYAPEVRVYFDNQHGDTRGYSDFKDRLCSACFFHDSNKTIYAPGGVVERVTCQPFRPTDPVDLSRTSCHPRPFARTFYSNGNPYRYNPLIIREVPKHDNVLYVSTVPWDTDLPYSTQLNQLYLFQKYICRTCPARTWGDYGYPTIELRFLDKITGRTPPVPIMTCSIPNRKNIPSCTSHLRTT